jgi:hypothetical protein
MSGFNPLNCQLILGRDTYQTFVQVDSEVLRNRQLRQHAKR